MIQDVDARLPEIVVTAARLPPAAGDAAFSLVRLDRGDLAQAPRLDEAITQVPAVSLFRRTSSLTANPTTQGLSLRAIAPSGAARALVTLDGVPLNDPFGGWVIWSQVAPESLDGVDIVRGAGAGPYGAVALTGVIALREREAGGVLDASMAEYGGRRVAASAALPAGRFTLTGSALIDRSDGYVPVRGPRAGAADTPLQLDARSAGLRADLGVTDDIRLSLRASAWEEDRESGLAGARSTASGDAVSATLARAPSVDRTGWRVQLWRRDSDLANTSVAVAADRASTTPANDQFATPATGWGANLAVRRTVVALRGGHVEWEFGADGRFSEGETRERFRYMGGAFTRERTAGGRTAVVGAYGEAAWTRGPWLVAGGLRLDRWKNTDGRRLETDRATGLPTLDETDPDRAGEVVSGRFAVRRDLGDGFAVRAAAYSGFRPATLNELHRPFRVGNDLTEANAALTPETLKGIEVGLSWSDGATRVEAAVFRNRIDDAIVNVTVGVGPATFPRAGFVPAGGVLRQRRNAGTIKATGVEVSVSHALTGDLDLTLAASATDARVDGGTAAPQLTGLHPAQAPEWSVVAGLDWRVSERLSLSVGLRHESARFEDDLNSRTLAAATTADVRATWRVRDGVAIYGTVDNLSDAAVEVSRTGDDVAGYGPPRTVRVGLTVAW